MSPYPSALASQPAAGEDSHQGDFPLPAIVWLDYPSCLLREAADDNQRQSRHIAAMCRERGETSDDDDESDDDEELQRLHDASDDCFYDFITMMRTLLFIDPEAHARVGGPALGKSHGSNGLADALVDVAAPLPLSRCHVLRSPLHQHSTEHNDQPSIHRQCRVVFVICCASQTRKGNGRKRRGQLTTCHLHEAICPSTTSLAHTARSDEVCSLSRPLSPPKNQPIETPFPPTRISAHLVAAVDIVYSVASNSALVK